MANLHWFLVVVMLVCVVRASPDDSAYAKSLLKFRESLTNAGMLDNWREPVDELCSGYIPKWNGTLCDNGTFIGLRLEGMGLRGKLDIDSLSDVPIFSLSVMNNNFSGQFPSSLNKLSKLRSLYLANNNFGGGIPDDAFKGMNGMRKVVIGDNKFTGRIPLSLLGLRRLVLLEVQDNQFEGRIPDFWQANLTVNFANNRLEDAIPSTLANQSASSFAGKISVSFHLVNCFA